MRKEQLIPDSSVKRLAFVGKVTENGITIVPIGKPIAFRQYDREIPVKLAKYDGFKAKVVAAKDDNEKLQELLDGTPAEQLLGFLNRCRGDKEKVLTDLSSALREVGFYPHKKLKFFATKLREKGIPVRGVDISNEKSNPQIQWITYSKWEEGKIDALKNDPSLQKFRENPVQLIYGTIGEMPTTTQLFKKDGYSNVSNLILEIFGIRLRGHNLVKLLENCPFPIIKVKARNTYFFPDYRKRDITNFLNLKLGIG